MPAEPAQPLRQYLLPLPARPALPAAADHSAAVEPAESLVPPMLPSAADCFRVQEPPMRIPAPPGERQFRDNAPPTPRPLTPGAAAGRGSAHYPCPREEGSFSIYLICFSPRAEPHPISSICWGCSGYPKAPNLSQWIKWQHSFQKGSFLLGLVLIPLNLICLEEKLFRTCIYLLPPL